MKEERRGYGNTDFSSEVMKQYYDLHDRVRDVMALRDPTTLSPTLMWR